MARRLVVVLRLDPRFQLLPGNHEVAIKYCGRSIAEQQNQARAMQRMAATFAVMGATERAHAVFAQMIALQPDFCADYLKAT